jgi:hypothetical protein
MKIPPNNTGFTSTFIMISLVLTGAICTYTAMLLNSAVSLESRSTKHLKDTEAIEHIGIAKQELEAQTTTSCATISLGLKQHQRSRNICGFFPWNKDNSIPNYLYYQKQTMPCPPKSGVLGTAQSKIYSEFSCTSKNLNVIKQLVALHGDLDVLKLQLHSSNDEPADEPAQLYASGNVQVGMLLAQGEVLIIAGGKITIKEISNEMAHSNVFLYSAVGEIDLPDIPYISGKVTEQTLPKNWPALDFQIFSFTPAWQNDALN